MSEYETAQRLHDWVASAEPVNIWELERLDDVMWEAHGDKATMASFVVAGAEHSDIMAMPFPQAMRLGRAVLDGPLFRMVSTWLREERIQWGAIRYELAAEMEKAYRMARQP
jgi:hypothetical protein